MNQVNSILEFDFFLNQAEWSKLEMARILI